MRTKHMLIIIVLLLLWATVNSQTEDLQQNSRSGKNEGRKRGKQPGRINPKCRNIKCEDGFFCFQGRCKKIDEGCLNMKCQKGFRCKKGQCIQQLHQPKKQICAPLGFTQRRFRCGQQQQERCLKSKLSIKVCTYFQKHVQEYDNECIACSTNPQIQFYFQLPCLQAPAICSEFEQCLNGSCMKLFNEAQFENHAWCNHHRDCKIKQWCGGHKCIDKQDMFNYLQSKAELNPNVQLQ